MDSLAVAPQRFARDWLRPLGDTYIVIVRRGARHARPHKGGMHIVLMNICSLGTGDAWVRSHWLQPLDGYFTAFVRQGGPWQSGKHHIKSGMHMRAYELQKLGHVALLRFVTDAAGKGCATQGSNPEQDRHSQDQTGY